MASPDVSVVIPNRDGAGLVGRCVGAALAAGAREVVVVDDGSRDESPAEAAAAGARVVRSHGRGFAAAVNRGVADASHDLLLLLNSDCFLAAGALTQLVDAVERDPRLGLCGAGLTDEQGTVTKSHGHELTLSLALRAAASLAVPPAPRDAASGLQGTRFVPLACALVRRGAWTSVGGLDERYRFYFEDQDVAWRLRRAGWRLAVCWDARAVHIGGASSQERDPQGWFRQFHESRALYLRKRYPRAWPLYAAVWIPSALAHAGLWLLRDAPDARRWARAYAASALAGLR